MGRKSENQKWVERMVAEKKCASLPVVDTTAKSPAVSDAAKQMSTCGDSREARKSVPIASGVLDYFPDALAAVAYCSHIGNEQHNPGTPLHWDRDKSKDHADCMIRHYMDRGTTDGDGVLHAAKMAWRALALLQCEIEESRK